MVESFLPAAVVRALGWTLVHSLWQGFLVCLLLLLAGALLPGTDARLRYRAGGLALLAILAMAVATFTRYYLAGPVPAEHAPAAIQPLSAALPAAAGAHSGASGATFLLEPYFGAMVWLWLAGLLVLSLRLAGGLACNRRLRRAATRELDQQWQRRLQAFARVLGVSRPVRLLVSARAAVPMAIGFLKPAIILPATALTGLPVAELEAILLHELGHIRRNDYLWNLLQSLTEVLFFYHPGVWWISNRIRTSREHCCDDLAVAVTGDPMTFAKALTKLQEVTMTPHLAMAANGGKRKLLKRITRLFAAPAPRAGLRGGLTLACMLAFGLLASATMMIQAGKNAPAGQEDSVGELARKAFGQQKTGTVTLHDPDSGKELSIMMHQGNVTAFFIDGLSQEIGVLADYLPRIREYYDEAPPSRKAREVREAPVATPVSRAVAPTAPSMETPESIAEVAALAAPEVMAAHRHQAQVERMASLEREEIARREERLAAMERTLAEKARRLEHEVQTRHEEARKMSEAEKQVAEEKLAIARKALEKQAEVQSELLEQRERLAVARSVLEEGKVKLEEHKQTFAGLKADVSAALVAEGYVGEGEDWTVRLSAERQELYINGNLQDGAVYEKYKTLCEMRLGPLTGDFVISR